MRCCTFAFVRTALSVVRRLLTVVGDSVPLIGDAISFVSDPFATRLLRFPFRHRPFTAFRLSRALIKFAATVGLPVTGHTPTLFGDGNPVCRRCCGPAEQRRGLTCSFVTNAAAAVKGDS